MPTFLAYVEYMLCYHAWCHNLHLLPIEQQEDYDLIDFGSKILMRNFDSTILVIPTPVKSTHNCTTARVIALLVTQCSTTQQWVSLFKVWAKGMSQMALEQGIDKFMYSTSSHVVKRMLLETITDQLQMQNDKEQEMPIVQACISKRQLSYF
jgi:hypothetical protein